MVKNKAPVYPTILREGLISVKLVRKKATRFTNDKLFNLYYEIIIRIFL